MDEHQNAGDATSEAQRQGDFTHGEAAGPYGGTAEDSGGETPTGTSSEARQVEHVGDGEQTGEDGEAAEGEGGEGSGTASNSTTSTHIETSGAAVE